MHMKSLAIILIALCLPAISMAEMLSVGFSGTEVRSQPNAMTSSVVAKVAPYSPLLVIEKGTEYFKVKDYRGQSGWVHRSLLSTTPGIVATGGSVNVRQGPGTNHPVIFQLAKGMTAKFLKKQDGWVQLETADGAEGWVADFLVWGD